MTITLATLAQATAQEVFDQGALHMLTQNKKASMNGDMGGMCMYRAPDGSMCVGGCFIDNNEYSRQMEQWGNWPGLVLQLGLTSLHKELILDLQEVHDRSPVSAWPSKLIKVASFHQLCFDVVLDFGKQS